MTTGRSQTSRAYSTFQLGPKYLGYLFGAANSRGHGIHSPFIFDLVTRVFNDRTVYPEYIPIERLRLCLLRNKGMIVPTLDFGAGAGGTSGLTPPVQGRSLSSIARTALKPPKFGQLFFRLSRYLRPGNILELGTSLGVSTAYLAAGNPKASVITMEGAPAIASLARQHFSKLGLERIRLMEGNFDDTLSEALEGIPGLDLAYIDGNHRLEPTLRYFHQMKPRLHEYSVLIFDDIHWSPEMENAWETLSRDPMVTCSVDLFYIGILFFRKEFHTPQHFSIRF